MLPVKGRSFTKRTEVKSSLCRNFFKIRLLFAKTKMFLGHSYDAHCEDLVIYVDHTLLFRKVRSKLLLQSYNTYLPNPHVPCERPHHICARPDFGQLFKACGNWQQLFHQNCPHF